jgi:succinate dehydrogenase/fumarate reductase flavoprotein subunit
MMVFEQAPYPKKISKGPPVLTWDPAKTPEQNASMQKKAQEIWADQQVKEQMQKIKDLQEKIKQIRATTTSDQPNQPKEFGEWSVRKILDADES